MKKSLLPLLCSLLCSVAAYAQPQAFKYSAVAVSPMGQPVTDPVAVRFSVRENSANGPVRYEEVHNTMPNNNGKFNLDVGRGNATFGQFSTLDWGANQYWLQVELAINGGSFNQYGVDQLLSVPYAMYAGASGGDPSDNDADPTNELQKLIATDSTLSLVPNGGQVALPAGPKGDKGDPGVMGLKGDKGDPGVMGLKGDKGDPGVMGLKGDKGDQGDMGLKGDKGDQGDMGLKGDKGDQGDMGLKGDKGDQGDMGLKGDKGDQGDMGLKGDKGDQGDMGLKGDKGDQGDMGLKGDKGDQGVPGVAGPTGPSGAANLEQGMGIVLMTNNDTTLVMADNDAQIWNANKLRGRPIDGMPPNPGFIMAYKNDTDGWVSYPNDMEITANGTMEVIALRGRPIDGMPPNPGFVMAFKNDAEGWVSYPNDLEINNNRLEVASIRGLNINMANVMDGMSLVCKDDGIGGLEFQCQPGFNIPYQNADNYGSVSMVDIENFAINAQLGMRVRNNGNYGIQGIGNGVNSTWSTANNNPASGNSLSNPNFFYPAGIYGSNSNPGSGSTAGAGVLGRAMGANNNNRGVGGWFQGASVGTIGASYTNSYTGVLGWCHQGNHGGAFFLTPASGVGPKEQYAAVYGKTFNTSLAYAGYFQGDVHVNGNLSKSSGDFKIDHPQYPAEKYLVHSFVESPDMKNIYDGVVTTDAQGFATVELPGYFEALNKDFRYQLTCIGDFAQAIISKKVENNRFIIRTDKPGMEVSWQVTGIRKDPWAEAHRLVPEVDKSGEERGKYLNPEVYGKPEALRIGNGSLEH